MINGHKVILSPSFFQRLTLQIWAISHPGGCQQVPRLRRPRTQFCPRALRQLGARVPAGLLPQRPLVPPLVPPEEGPAIWGAPDRDDPLSGPTPAISPSASPRCCAPISATTATCSRTCAASPASACSNTCAPPLPCPGGLPGVVMTVHTFGEYFDFHPRLHALVADGLFVLRAVPSPARCQPQAAGRIVPGADHHVSRGQAPSAGAAGRTCRAAGCIPGSTCTAAGAINVPPKRPKPRARACG